MLIGTFGEGEGLLVSTTLPVTPQACIISRLGYGSTKSLSPAQGTHRGRETAHSLVYTMPWVLFPEAQKPGVVVQTYNLSQSRKDLKFRVILSYIASLGLPGIQDTSSIKGGEGLVR